MRKLTLLCHLNHHKINETAFFYMLFLVFLQEPNAKYEVTIKLSIYVPKNDSNVDTTSVPTNGSGGTGNISGSFPASNMTPIMSQQNIPGQDLPPYFQQTLPSYKDRRLCQQRMPNMVSGIIGCTSFVCIHFYMYTTPS